MCDQEDARHREYALCVTNWRPGFENILYQLAVVVQKANGLRHLVDSDRVILRPGQRNIVTSNASLSADIIFQYRLQQKRARLRSESSDWVQRGWIQAQRGWIQARRGWIQAQRGWIEAQRGWI
jgi:hypothetical protein